MLLDCYLKLTDPALEGENTDDLHAKEIGVFSFEHVITRADFASAGDSETAAKPRSDHAPIRIIKPLDKTTPKLLEAACKGTLYKQGVLSFCQSSGTSDNTSSSWKKIVYFEVTLEQVYITRAHLMADPRLSDVNALGPLEEIDLSYRKIKWLYKGGTGKANISGGWNLATNSNG